MIGSWLGASARSARPSEVALALAIFHRRLGERVVGAGRAALGDARADDLGDDVVDRLRPSDSTAPVQLMSPTVRKRTASRSNGSSPCMRGTYGPSASTSRRAGRRRADGRSRSTGSRAARARCTARRRARSSSRSGRRGSARPGDGGRCRWLHSSGRWLRGSHWPNSSRREKMRSLARAFSSSRRRAAERRRRSRAPRWRRAASPSGGGCATARGRAPRDAAGVDRRLDAGHDEPLAELGRRAGRGSRAPRGSCGRCRRA